MFNRGMLAVTLVTLLAACGSKSDSSESPPAAEKEEEKTNPSLASIDSGSEALSYAIAALSSSGEAASGAALNLDGGQGGDGGGQGGDGSSQGGDGGGQGGDGSSQGGGGDDEGSRQHATVKKCTIHGSPFKDEGSGRMFAGDPGYAERTIYCQLNVADSPETVLGSLGMAKKVLCTSEKSIGKKVEYTAAGKVYKDVKLNMTTDCGWDERSIAEMANVPPVQLTAKSYATGDWQKSVNIVMPDMDFTLYYTVSGDIIAIRKMEGWDHDARCEESPTSCNSVIPKGATGNRGDVIAIDLKAGELRAETSDNYWGRRARGLFKGDLDGKTGKFKSITDMSFLYADAYANDYQGQTYLGGQVASAKGSSTAGIAYVGGSYMCGNGACSLASFATEGKVTGPGVECSVTGGCAGNTGYDWSFSNAKVLDFIRLGASFDDHSGTRSKNEDWLKAAKIPTFTSVDFSAALP